LSPAEEPFTSNKPPNLSFFDEIPFLVVVHLYQLKTFGLSHHELVNGLVAARPRGIVVLIEQNDASRDDPRIEEPEAVAVRIIQVNVEMHEGET
jgi:hypothetical protein